MRGIAAFPGSARSSGPNTRGALASGAWSASGAGDLLQGRTKVCPYPLSVHEAFPLRDHSSTGGGLNVPDGGITVVSRTSPPFGLKASQEVAKP